MAADMIFPPWLQYRPQPNPIEAYQGGAEIGLHERAQQQSEFQAAQRIALAQQEETRREQDAAQQFELQQRQQMQADQQQAIANEYHQQQYKLQQQEQERLQQQSQIAVQAAARKFQAQQAVQAEIQQGVPVQQAVLHHAAELQIPYTGLAQLAKTQTAFAPHPVSSMPVYAPGTTNAMPGVFAVPNAAGTGQNVMRDPAFVAAQIEERAAKRERAKDLNARKKDILADRNLRPFVPSDEVKTESKERKAKREELQAELDSINQELATIAPPVLPSQRGGQRSVSQDDPLGLYK